MAKKGPRATVGNHRALLIGVADYDRDFNPLRGPVNDVRALAEVLGSPPLGMYTVTPVENPSDEMANTISEFLESATSNDNVVVYFSGHGAVDDNGRLYLTHTRSRSSLKGSGLKYDDFNEWVHESRAQSVLVVLDCCRAGKADKKGADPVVQAVRDALRDADSHTQRVRVMLAAVPGHLDAEDAETADALSPFTERFIEAIRAADPRTDGVVDLRMCLNRLWQIYDDAGLVRPRPTGSHEFDAIELARRPDFAVKLLEREGLTPSLPTRRGVAIEDGIEIIVPTAAANSAFCGLSETHPAAVLVGGKEGTGKTWLLCEVVERMTAAGWTVHGFRPSGATPWHAGSLVSAISTYLSTHPAEGKVLVVVDGIEWSDEWRQVIEQLGRVVYEDRVSLLVAAESLSTTDWRLPGATTKAAPGTLTEMSGFVRELIGGGYYPELSRLPIADRQGLESELRRLAPTDLWAAVHLAPLVTRQDVVERAGERLWRERVGRIDDPGLSLALWLIAALSSYGIWAPVNPVSEPGIAIAQRLGADVNDAGVRITSSFVNRALLARIDGEVPLNFNWNATAKHASQFMQMYITTCLETVNRHDEATAALARLKLHRTGFDSFVTELAEANGFSWKKWESICTSAATVAATMLVIRSHLPPGTARYLAERLADRVEDGQLGQAPMPVLLNCLQVLRLTPGIQRDASLTDAWSKLLALIEHKLTSEHQEAETRLRALRLVHRFGSAESIASLRALGPLLIAPQTPVSQEDLRVFLELSRLLERSGSADGRALRKEMLRWPEATILVDEGAKRTASRSAGYLARWLVAARIMNIETRDSSQEQRLLRVVRSAAINELRPIIDFCQSHFPALAHMILEAVEGDQRLRGRLRETAPSDLADWIQTLGRTSPRKAAMQLRRGPATLNRALIAAQEKAIRVSSDRVACGRLLAVTTRVEDQIGLLENGFAATLATTLGTKFLATQLVIEHRPSVMAYMITGFLRATVQLDEELMDTALKIVSEDVKTVLTERGPRLALILADNSADGEQFLAKLRGFPTMSRRRFGEYMRSVRELSAVAAFHRLGILLYPDIAAEYLIWLDEDDLQKRTFLRDIREGMEPIPALEAANAITATLRIAGDTTLGPQLLGHFDQLSGRGDWARRLWQLEPADLPRALSLFHKLSPEDARTLLANSQDMLHRKLSSSVEMPAIFFSILYTVARIDGPAIGDLIDRLSSDGTFDLVAEQLGTEADLFTLVEVLRQVMYTADRTSRQILPDSLLEELFATAQSDLPKLTNPRTVARLLESLAAWRTARAADAATGLNLYGMRKRISHRKQDESRDTAHLADVLFDLDASLVNELLDEAAFTWLLTKAPIDRLGALVEVGLRQFPVIDTVRIVRSRFTDIGGRPFTHDMWEVCMALGDVAWSVQRFGSAPLDVPQPPNLDLITQLPADTVLHALVWLPSSQWRNTTLEQLLNVTSEGCAVPPSSPNEAAARVAAHLHLGWHDRWGNEEARESLWQLASTAAATQMRPLAGALTALSDNDRRSITHPHREKLSAARERIRTGRFAWRRYAQETIGLLDQVLVGI